MTFDDALEEVASADADLAEVVRILCGMATFAGLVGRVVQRDRAVEVTAELLSVRIGPQAVPAYP